MRLDWSDMGGHGWDDLEKVRAHLAAGADPNAAEGANALTGEGHLGRAYDLTGPLWTYPEVAQALGVAYEEVPDAGPGPMAWLNGLVRAGALERQTGDLEALLGRPAETVVERLTT